MLLWLPLFSGSALAATISMQMPQGSCHEEASSQTMPGMDMGEHHQHHGETPTTDEHSPSCSAVCHLACTGYLAMPGAELVAAVEAARDNTPYLVLFQSVTSAPLVPPPLARA